MQTLESVLKQSQARTNYTTSKYEQMMIMVQYSYSVEHGWSSRSCSKRKYRFATLISDKK